MLPEIEGLAERFPDIPVEAIFKEDLLRQGMAWTPEALEIAAKYTLPPPIGYGEPGLGKAVFSVSSFMDVLPPI